MLLLLAVVYLCSWLGFRAHLTSSCKCSMRLLSSSDCEVLSNVFSSLFANLLILVGGVQAPRLTALSSVSRSGSKSFKHKRTKQQQNGARQAQASSLLAFATAIGKHTRVHVASLCVHPHSHDTDAWALPKVRSHVLLSIGSCSWSPQPKQIQSISLRV